MIFVQNQNVYRIYQPLVVGMIIFIFVSNLGHLYTKSLEWVTSKIFRHCAICIRLIFDVIGGLWLFECKLFHLIYNELFLYSGFCRFLK